MDVLRVGVGIDRKLLGLAFCEIQKKVKNGFEFWRCPICDWPFLMEDPALLTYEICVQCGVEFGLDDSDCTWEELRENWAKHRKPFGKFQWEKEADRAAP